MSDRAKPLLTWGLRLLGVGLLAWVLATQVQWLDRVTLLDGSAKTGAIHIDDAGAIVVAPEHGADSGAVRIPAEVVAVRTYGGQDVPDVTYGARTLLGRLQERLGVVALVLAVLTFLVILTGARWRLLLRGVGIEMPLLRAVRLTFIGGFFNMAVPGSTGGDFVKAWYARKDAKARYPERVGVGTHAILSVFVDRFVGLFGLVLFAAGALVFGARGEAFDVPRLVVLAVLAVGTAAGVVVLSRGVRRALGLSWLVQRLPLQHVLAELRAAAGLYRGHKGALGVAMGISLFNHAGNATCCWLLAQALGIEGISLGTAMALVPIANLLSAIPLLPGGWGVGELAFAYFFGLVGVPPTEAIGLSVVFRLAVLGVNLPGGLLWVLWKGHASTDTISADMESASAHVADSLSAANPATPEETT